MKVSNARSTFSPKIHQSARTMRGPRPEARRARQHMRYLPRVARQGAARACASSTFYRMAATRALRRGTDARLTPTG